MVGPARKIQFPLGAPPDLRTTLLLLCAGGTFFFLRRAGFTYEDWFFWLSIEQFCVGQALLGFPYLLFAFLPVEAVTGTSATGYSVHGWLSRQLDLTEIREVRKFADERKRPRGGVMASMV